MNLEVTLTKKYIKKTKTNTESRILKILAHNKEFEQYKLDKTLEISYRTILRKLETMEKNFGIIKLVRTEPSTKGGKDKKIYSITLKGLWLHLSEIKQLNSPKGKEEIIKIINLFPEMLLFFKKWPLFIKSGLQDEMLGYFIEALKSSWLDYQNRIGLLHTSEMQRETFHKILDHFDDKLEEFLDSHTLVDPMLVSETKERLRIAYLQDQELNTFVNKIIATAERNQLRIKEIKSCLNEKTKPSLP